MQSSPPIWYSRDPLVLSVKAINLLRKGLCPVRPVMINLVFVSLVNFSQKKKPNMVRLSLYCSLSRGMSGKPTFSLEHLESDIVVVTPQVYHITTQPEHGQKYFFSRYLRCCCVWYFLSLGNLWISKKYPTNVHHLSLLILPCEENWHSIKMKTVQRRFIFNVGSYSLQQFSQYMLIMNFAAAAYLKQCGPRLRRNISQVCKKIGQISTFETNMVSCLPKCLLSIVFFCFFLF